MPPVLFRDLLTEIRRSLGRYLSILLIVALGVAFFAGIKASPPDMKESADSYFDRYRLQDLQVFSTLGLHKEDLEAMAKLDGVEAVQGLYTQDVLVKIGNSEQAWKLFSLPEKNAMNDIRLEEGRLPDKPGECLIEGSSMESGLKGTFAIGDSITLSSGTDTPLTDTLEKTEYTVVGKGYTPRYLSYEMGTTAIGSGSVDGFLFVPESDIKADYLTEADITVKGAKDLNSYGDGYFDLTDPVKTLLEQLGKDRIEAQMEDSRQEIRKAKDSLSEETEKAEQKLADARKEISQGESEIASNRKMLENSRSELDAGWQELQAGKAELESQEAAVSQGLEQIRQAQAQKETLQSSLPQIQTGLEQARQGRSQAEQGLAAINDGLAQIDSGLASVDTNALNAQKSQLELTVAALQQQIAAAEDPNARGLLEEQLAQAQAALSQVQTGLDTAAGLQARKEQLLAQKSQAQEGLEQAATAVSDLEASEKQVQEGLARIAQAEQNLPALQEAQNQIDAGRTSLVQGEARLNDGETQYADGLSQIARGEASLQDARKQLEEGQKELKDKTASGQDEIRKAQDQLDSLDPQWVVLDRDSFYSWRDYKATADRMDGIASVFPVFFFLVAALVCMTTMTRMVDEQRSQIGTLKALGYSRTQIAMKYILYSLSASLLGAIVGCLVGMTVFPYIIFYAWNTMYTIDSMHMVFQPELALLASGSVSLVILATTLYSIARELREVPAQLMRPKAGVAGKKILLERLPRIWNRVPFMHKVTIRNIFRYKKRLFMTVIGIAGCSALLVAGFGINDSISSIVSEQFGTIYQYDVEVTADSSGLQSELKKLDHVTGVYAEQTLPVTMEIQGDKASGTLRITDGKDLDAFVNLESADHESLAMPDAGVLVSQKMAEKMHLEKGSGLVLTTADDQEIRTTVSGIFTQYVGHQIYVTPKVFDSWQVKEKPLDVYLLKTDDTSEAAEETLGQKITAMNDVRSVSFYSKVQQNFLDMIGSIQMVVVVLVLSAAMLAFVVLYNLANVNISERVREIATIKVLGYTEREVNAYVNRESMILAIIGGLAGLGLGIWLHRLIMNLAELDDVMFGRVISPLSFVIAFVLTVIFAAAVNFVMRFRLRKVEMVESLKAVE